MTGKIVNLFYSVLQCTGMVHLPPSCNLTNSLRAVLYLGLTLLCLLVSSYTVEKYLAGEIIETTSYKEQTAVLFPSITFCRKFLFNSVSSN
jgi:hypothetical protein